MNIYVAHSRAFDFENELYVPLKNSAQAREHVFTFPHEEDGASFSSKEFFKKGCDLVIAEVSYPATGLGIELGWADDLGIPIVCVYMQGTKLSGSLPIVSTVFLEYSNADELVERVGEAVAKVAKGM